MSGRPEDTGQISVADLLARNGAQVESRGGRRRRGAPGGINVTELTGELPVVSDTDAPRRNRRAAPDPDDVADRPEIGTHLGSLGIGAASADVGIPAIAEEPAAAESATGESVAEEPAAAVSALPTAAGVEPVIEHTQAIPALRRAVLAKADADRKAETERKAESDRKAEGRKAAVERVLGGMSSTPAPSGAAAQAAAPAVPPVQVEAPAQARAESPAEKTTVVAESAVEKTTVVAPESAAEKTTVVPATPVTTGRRARPEPPATAPADTVQAGTGPKAKVYTGTPDVREPALLAGSSLEADLLRQARTARTESPDEARALVHTTGEFPRVGGGRADEAAEATPSGAEAVDESEDADGPAASSTRASSAPPAKAPAGSALRQWAVLAGQAVVAIVAGALLFKGFEKLWESLPWVALVLAVLVIAGLVAVVRILRQTEDLLSLLIAVIVGVFVTIGPLVFVLSSS